MTDSVLHYFKAEKKYSIYGIGLGLFSVMLTIYFLLKGQPYYNGISYALIAIGMIQLISGMTVYLRNDLDIVSVDYFIQKDLEMIKDKEMPRMNVLLKNLQLYLKAEIACAILGLLLWMCCNPHSLGKGIGIGLTIQSAVMFLLDYLAEQRGKVYFDFLGAQINHNNPIEDYDPNVIEMAKQYQKI